VPQKLANRRKTFVVLLKAETINRWEFEKGRWWLDGRQADADPVDGSELRQDLLKRGWDELYFPNRTLQIKLDLP